MMTADSENAYLKVDSRRLSVGEYRRSLGRGPRLWAALLLKLLRIRIGEPTAYPADTEVRPIAEDDLTQGARVRLGHHLRGLSQHGFELVCYQSPPLLGQVTKIHSALLEAKDEPTYATVVDVETQAGGHVERRTFTNLFSALDTLESAPESDLEEGRWLVTTSNPVAFDPPPGVEQRILPNASAEQLLQAHRDRLSERQAGAPRPAQVALESYSRLLLEHSRRTGRLVPIDRDEVERLRRRSEPPPPTRRRTAGLSPMRSLLLWVVVFILVILIWNLLQSDSGEIQSEVVDLAQEPLARAMACDPGSGLADGAGGPGASVEANRRWLTVSARLPESERASALYDDLYLALTTGGVFAVEAPWTRAGPLDDPDIRRARRTFVAFEETRYREGVDQPLGCLAGLVSLMGREPDLTKQGEETAVRQREALELLVAEDPSLDAELIDLHVQWVTAGYGLDGSDWSQARDRWIELLGGDPDLLEPQRFEEASHEQLAVGGYVVRDGALLNVDLWGEATSELLPALAEHLCREGAASVHYRVDD